MVDRWIAWLGDRVTSSSTVPLALVKLELELLIDVFASMVGPLRRETKPIWFRTAEQYGRHAAARGLAAGEVVEEMQYLRELLIRFLAPAIAALRPRQGMALLLRLNRLVDRGVAMAVVGYTDALVAGFLSHQQDDTEARTGSASDSDSIEEVLRELRAELEQTVSAPQPGA